MNKIEIFKTGKHTATNGAELDATADYLRGVVASYQPNHHEAPAVVGHPKDNHPAYGWVKGLSFDEGSGTLYADFDQVEPQFLKLLKAGRFKKRSASFYDADHPSNPTPGKPYLRHVGFLGAQPPAVKGLKDFSDDADCAIYEFSESSTHEDITMSDKAKSPPAEAGQTADFAEREAKLASDEQALAAREAAIEQREKILADEQAAVQKKTFTDFADTLIASGKIPPAEKDAVVSVFIDVDNAGSSFDFAEGGEVTQKTGVDALKGIFSRLPAVVDFAEHTATDPNGRALPQATDHNSGQRDEDALDKKITDFAEAQGISYAEAAANFMED